MRARAARLLAAAAMVAVAALALSPDGMVAATDVCEATACHDAVDHVTDPCYQHAGCATTTTSCCYVAQTAAGLMVVVLLVGRSAPIRLHRWSGRLEGAGLERPPRMFLTA